MAEQSKPETPAKELTTDEKIARVEKNFRVLSIGLNPWMNHLKQVVAIFRDKYGLGTPPEVLAAVTVPVPLEAYMLLVASANMTTIIGNNVEAGSTEGGVDG